MKVTVLGAAGMQAQGVIRDLCNSLEVTEVVLADLERAKDTLEQRSKDWGENKTGVAFVNVNDAENLRKVIRGSKVCAHCISHVFNLQVMDACLAEGCHYTDLGGLFHYYRKQVTRHEKWRARGLTAVLGMGSAPGITNVLARYAADCLDTIEYIHLRDGIVNYAKSDFPLTVPYAIGTLLQEFSDNCYIFANGDWVEVPAFSQEEVVDFGDPVGTMRVYATIHSEVASVPVSFKSKGIKDMSFKLGLPPDFELKMRFLAGIGLGSSTPLDIKGMKISPIEFFAALAQTFPKPTGKPADYKCLRVDAKGLKNGIVTDVQTEVKCYPCEPWNMKTGPYSVGVPVGIVCRMLVNGEILERGCMPAELCVPPDLFFKHLAKRNMHSTIKIKTPIA
jgi:saccharopine dehydrogenase-like NADP-dependent oxidoreductase